MKFKVVFIGCDDDRITEPMSKEEAQECLDDYKGRLMKEKSWLDFDEDEGYFCASGDDYYQYVAIDPVSEKKGAALLIQQIRECLDYAEIREVKYSYVPSAMDVYIETSKAAKILGDLEKLVVS